MISKRAQNIAPSATLAIGAKVAAFKKQGVHVVSFGAGEPDFDTPEHIKKAAIKAIEEGFTKYTPSSGIPELKEAIVKKFKKDNGLTYTAQQILVSNGAKQCLYNIFQVLFDPGDEVIVPVPYWVSYEEMIKLAGGRAIFLQSGKDFRVRPDDIKKKITKRTKALILNSPSNPTGVVYDKKTLFAIAGICAKNGIYVISDEIYEHLIYGKKHISIASLGRKIKDLTFVVNGVSKTFAMTGWRIGYAAGPEEYMRAASSLQDHTTSNPNSIAQKAALAALSGPLRNVATMKKEYVKRRDYMVKHLSAMPGVSVVTPDGAFYVFADVSRLYKKRFKGSDDFSNALLESHHVAVVPGSAFGDDRCIRLSFATDMQSIKKGLDGIKRFVNSLV